MRVITHTYANHCKHHKNRIAIQSQDYRVSYEQWYKLVNKTANWLMSLKKDGKVIAFHMPNGIPFLQLFAGTAAAGLIAAPLDVKWTEEELRKRIELCSPAIIITLRSMKDSIEAIHPNVLVWEQCIKVIDQSSERFITKIDAKLPFYMGFTSGSTGDPKAFVRSHESWVASFECNMIDFQMNQNEQVIIPGALIHSHFLYGAISTLFLGGTIYLLEKFSVNQLLVRLKKYPITVIYMVPTMIEALLKEKCTYLKAVKIISSGAKWEAEAKERMRRMFPNLNMYEFYGASELSFITVLSHQENIRKPRSVGKPCRNVEIQIRKRDGDVALPFEVGKIYVRSKLAFLGYVQKGSTKIQSIQDEEGWSTIHDMGYVDEAGFLYLKGREQNMILYGGINIFPEEIEAVLSLHPKVEEVVIIGVADRYWGEIVAAVIKGRASKIELRRLCQKKLAPYKIPRKWYFVDDIPLTISGKIARPLVKEMIKEEEY